MNHMNIYRIVSTYTNMFLISYNKGKENTAIKDNFSLSTFHEKIQVWSPLSLSKKKKKNQKILPIKKIVCPEVFF